MPNVYAGRTILETATPTRRQIEQLRESVLTYRQRCQQAEQEAKERSERDAQVIANGRAKANDSVEKAERALTDIRRAGRNRMKLRIRI